MIIVRNFTLIAYTYFGFSSNLYQYNNSTYFNFQLTSSEKVQKYTNLEEWRGEHVPTTKSGLPLEFEQEIEKYIKTGGKWTDELKRFISVSAGDEGGVAAEERMMAFRKVTSNKIGGFVTCALCEAAAYAAITYARNGGNMSPVRLFAINICRTIGYDQEFCVGAIDLNMPIILYVLEQKPHMDAKSVCGIIAQDICADRFVPLDWSINVYDDIPKVFTNRTSKGGNPLQIVHLTDAHVDFMYLEGAIAGCTNKPVCCRSDQGMAPSPDKGAGYWGDYRTCDSPVYAVTEIFERVRDGHPNLDAVYYTGDVVAHNVWSTTQEQVKDSMKFIFENLAKTFGDKPVYSIIGNHEAQPLNEFAPLNITVPEFATKWIYEMASDLWSKWLPKEVAESVKYGGFYSILAKPGFRIIGINSNVCYTVNWWLLLSPVDMYGQLQWLADEFRKAELAGEHVHLLSHVPPGNSDCEQIWTREFRRIISRFSHIIKGQFNGHTHRDEIKIFYDVKDPEHAISVAWNGGSMVPFSDVNSNYRILHVDPDTFEVLDFDNWVYNLTEANLGGQAIKPRWYKLYSFRDAYGVNSLAPEEIHGLLMRMAKDPVLMRKYLEHKGKHGDPFLLQNCDEKCIKDELCTIVLTEFNDTTQCELFGFN